MSEAQADYSRLAEVVVGLGLHEHLCVIYDTQEEQFAASLPFLRTGLERVEKCLYIVDENAAAVVLGALRKGATDVDGYLRSDTLAIAHKQDTYLKQGRFDPEGMIDFLAQATAGAEAARFSGMRILAEMTWVMGISKGADKLIEYENKVNRFFRRNNARALCQYHRARFSSETILGVIRTHPLVVYGGIICKNPYYVPPDEFLKPKQAAKEVERLLHNILAWEQAQLALRRSEDRLRQIIDTIPTMAWSVRTDGTIDFLNKVWLDYTGLSLQEGLEKPTSVVHPEDLPHVMEKWLADKAAGKPSEQEMRLRPADGEHRWFLVRSVPLRDGAGKIIKWYGSSVDIEDRKQAEDELRRQKEILQKIFANVPAMIGFVGSDGKIKLVNREWERTLGWTLGEVLGQDLDIFAELYPNHKYRKEVLNFVFASNGEFADFKTRVRDGRVIDTSWANVHLADGTTIGIGRDITERKRAEEALRRSEAYLNESQRLSHVGSWALNASTRELVFGSRENCRIFGFDPDKNAVTFQRALERLHPEDRPVFQQVLEKRVRQPSDFELDFRLVLPNGSLRYIHSTAHPIFDECGHLVEFVCTHMDETERKQAEELLRDSEDRFRATFENAGVAMALVNVEGHPVKCNPALQKLLGYSEEELSSMAFTEFTHPDDRELDWGLYGELTAGKRNTYEIEKRYLKKDGSVMWGLLTVSLVKGRPGRPAYAVGMVQDITERKQAEEALHKSRDQLRALAARLQSVREEERTRVAREIHDELGQTLTAIKIELSSLSRDMPEGKKQQAESILKLAGETIQSMRRISTDLRPAILDALGLVAAVEWATEEFEARTGTKCKLDLPQHDVVVDQERATAVFRIFQETLTNVARHAYATKVNVKLAMENGNLSLEVRDNGKGIDTERLSSGSSLGVLGMRERALLLGGELTISGALGKGTTVRVRIPGPPSKSPKVEK